MSSLESTPSSVDMSVSPEVCVCCGFLSFGYVRCLVRASLGVVGNISGPWKVLGTQQILRSSG